MAKLIFCSVAMLILCAKLIMAQAQLEGSLVVSNSNNGGGVDVSTLTVPGRRGVVTPYPSLDGSWLQSPAASGRDRHQFSLVVDSNGEESVGCVASLKNASVGFLCEDGRALEDVAYPSGCRGAYFESLWQVLYVGFDQPGCSPLKIELTGDGLQPFGATQEYQEGLAGKMVVVSRGEDPSFEDTIFYSYIDSGRLVHKSADDGTEFRISASIIGSCDALTDLHHFSNERPTIDIIVDCADSAGASRRYLVRAFFDFNVEEVLPISAATGRPWASQDGQFLAVFISGGNTHSIVLYRTSNFQSPIPVNYDYNGPLPHIKFLRAEDGHNYLAILREGNDVELLDLERLFTQGNSLEESRVQFPRTTVDSCTPTCPYSEIVSEDLFMVAVWNRERLQFDLRAIQLSTGDVATIPSGSSTSPVFAFVRLQLVPVVTPSPTASSTVVTPTTTAIQPTLTDLPSTVSLTATVSLTTSSSSIAVYPSPSTSPPPGPQRLHHHVIIGVVLSGIFLVSLLLVFVVLLCWLSRRKRVTKKKSIKSPIEASPPHGVEESGVVPPVQEDNSSISSSSLAPVQESENSSLNSASSLTGH